MLVNPRIKPGPADITDLRKNEVVQWQYRYYFPIVLVFGVLLSTFTAGYFWGDWRGGFFWATIIRIVIGHHVSLPRPSRSSALLK